MTAKSSSTVGRKQTRKKGRHSRAASALDGSLARSESGSATSVLHADAETGQLVSFMKQNLDRKHKRSALRLLLEQSQLPKSAEEAAAGGEGGDGLPQRGTQGSLYARGVAKVQASRSAGQNLLGFQTIMDNANKFSKKDSARDFDRVKSRLAGPAGRGEAH